MLKELESLYDRLVSGETVNAGNAGNAGDAGVATIWIANGQINVRVWYNVEPDAYPDAYPVSLDGLRTALKAVGDYRGWFGPIGNR